MIWPFCAESAAKLQPTSVIMIIVECSTSVENSLWCVSTGRFHNRFCWF